MRSLHVACLPYTSPQGTQALIHRQLSALAAAGHEVHLLTYKSGASILDRSYGHERHGGAKVSLRSGPSLTKVFADIAQTAKLRELCATLRPDVVVGHNVEGAAVTHLAQTRVPRLYMAHTRMDKELPTYFPRAVRGAAALMGRSLDFLASCAHHTATVSPWLAEHLGGTFVPPPWPLPAAISPEERAAARRGLGVQGTVGVYAGNLDAYQDWHQLRAICRRLTLVVATASDPGPLKGIARHVLPLESEGDRRRVHALADLALVPRGAPGGLPIKLLDALARGVPVVASKNALAGLSPEGVHTGETLADAMKSLQLSALGDGRRWIRDNASDAAFVQAMEEAMGIAIDKMARSVEIYRG